MGASTGALRSAAAAVALAGQLRCEVARAAGLEEEPPGGAVSSRSGPPAFFDYDCDLVGTIGHSVADWDDVYARVGANVALGNSSSFEFPPMLLNLIEGPVAEEAEEECPLGVLYLLVLNFYDRFTETAPSSDGVPGKGSELLAMYSHIQRLLGHFPVYAIALSRWPVFYALEHFAPRHEPQDEWFCSDVRNGVIDWADLRALSETWAEKKRGFADDEGIDDMEKEMSDRFYDVLKRRESQEQAQEECVFGFYFVIANQVVAAANRETHHLPPFNAIMDTVMAGVPFIRVAACGWPIFAVLSIFSDLNKGLWFFGGDRKYLRGYSDWNLRRDELSPIAPAALDFLSSSWKAAVSETVDALVQLPAAEFAHAVRVRVAQREEVHGPLRPIVRGLVDAALAVAAASAPPGHALAGRRLAYVVLLYGARWALLLTRLAGRLQQLGVTFPLLVIAIGEEAAASCKALAAAGHAGGGAGPAPQRVFCWTPDSQSQVHRFTAIHALLHMGVDVLYMDMDTFLLRDPTPRVLAQVAGLDALFARHADADCINIGVFFLRAHGRTAVWMSQFLAWYHDHPFEIDQRGLHVFLRLPAEQLKVAYPPIDLVRIEGGVLDDVNEVVIGDVGWYGDLSRMLIFHWCHRPLAQKEEEIARAYDAADVADAHGLSLAAAVSTASKAHQDSPWVKVLRFRAILESYRKDAPPVREPCW